MQILHPVQRVLDDDQKADGSSSPSRPLPLNSLLSSLTLLFVSGLTEEMRNLATELQTLVQAKVGVSAFSSVWNSITRGRALKRQARRYERVVKVRSSPYASFSISFSVSSLVRS